MALDPTEINLAKVSQPEHIFLEEHSKSPRISVTGDMQQPGGPYRQNGPQQSGCQKCIQCLCCCTLCASCFVQWCQCCEIILGCCQAFS